MPEPKPAPWRRAFLCALAQSGSVRLAATRAGIDHSTAYHFRKQNPAFALSWDRALARARAALDGAAPECAQHRPRLKADQVIRSSKTGKVCVARAGPGRWSAAAERRFLAVLTATANVKAAARAAGVSTTAAYKRKKLWPAFAADWAEAHREGYDRIELLLLCAATNTLDPEPEVADARGEGPEMSIDQAMNLLKLHHASQRGGKPQRYGWRKQEADIEEVRAEVLRRLAVMDRRGEGDAEP